MSLSTSARCLSYNSGWIFTNCAKKCGQSSFKLVGWFPGTDPACKSSPQIFNRFEVRTLWRLFQQLHVSLLYVFQNQSVHVNVWLQLLFTQSFTAGSVHPKVRAQGWIITWTSGLGLMSSAMNSVTHILNHRNHYKSNDYTNFLKRFI